MMTMGKRDWEHVHRERAWKVVQWNGYAGLLHKIRAGVQGFKGSQYRTGRYTPVQV